MSRTPGETEWDRGLELLPEVVFDFKSPAEERFFDLLTEADVGESWTAYHSLNLSEHEYKVWAEIDFLLLGPEVALVLEVKGGGIRREGGVWLYRDRYGVDHRSSEGPFNQAKSAMYALRDRLGELGARSVRERDLVFGWGVVFPDVLWDAPSPEHPSEVVADRDDLANPSTVERFIDQLKGYWIGKVRRPGGSLSRSDLMELRRLIRPNVDLYPPLTTEVGRVLTRMQRLTEEQYERMSIIRANDRAIVSGGAGTGKTYLALQLARSEVALGRSVLLIVGSPVLAAWLRKVEPDRRLRIEAFDLMQLSEPVDYLIVDEGQDLMDIDALSKLGERLEGGLERGRWCWFMDENRQAGLRGTFDPETLRYLERGLGREGVVRLPLTDNVRNTAEVAEKIEEWTGADLGRSRRAGHGRKPVVRVLARAEELPDQLGELILQLLDEGADPAEIGVVYPLAFEDGELGRLDRRLRRRLVPLDSVTVRSNLRGKILHGSVADFKGLERPIMICVGFYDTALLADGAPQLYVAATRANYGLYLLGDRDFVGGLIDRRRMT